ncbi:hypothetical protein EHS25_008430 [Saitozyma podzolica]|uniref:Uncharacterized protein n=1 Tax=Saitozyma podzolica TaxID=1890683 RepID=A0A427YPE8_9TREE|nr:hypothetical protein EHS25_008430 [Saitozyma podzolica]
MPSELLHLPPLYTLVGLYRLVTDPFIRNPVLDKIRHASIRGLVVGGLYAVGSWRVLDWFVRRFLVPGGAGLFGWGGGAGRGKVGEAVREAVGGKVNVGFGLFSVGVDLVFYTHLLILLPQLSSILRFFIYKNLKLARSRAYALTVSSRGKPHEFWSQGYIEEWASPPVPGPADLAGSRRSREAKWISWVLWWPTQLFLRHYLLLPLSPNLPLLSPLITCTLRSLQTAAYLHQPYFEAKQMTPAEVWRWVEERKWAYRAFGFAAALLESIPIAGLFFSISNRIGAAMWAFDLEKRQHLFSHSVLRPLPPDQVGWFGSGATSDLDVDIQAAEEEIERKRGWGEKGPGPGAGVGATPGAGSGEAGGQGDARRIIEVKGEGVGVGEKGREKVL